MQQPGLTCNPKKAELARVRGKYPDHVPVLCRQREDPWTKPGVPGMDKKLLVPRRMKVKEFKMCLMKYATKKEEGGRIDWDRIVLLVRGRGGRPLDPNAVVAELYEEYKGEDGRFQIELGLEKALSRASPVAARPPRAADTRATAVPAGSSEVSVPTTTSVSAKTVYNQVFFHMPDHDPQVEEPVQVSRVLEKFPTRVPVLCRQAERPGLPAIDKKLLAPRSMKLKDLKCWLQKHASAAAPVSWDKIRLFAGDLPLDPTADMDELYKHKDQDGLLHLEFRIREDSNDDDEQEEEKDKEEEADDEGTQFGNMGNLGNAAHLPRNTDAEKVVELEQLVCVLEKEVAAESAKAAEVQRCREADCQQMLELVAAKEAAELAACAAEDRALRAEEKIEALEMRACEQAKKADIEAQKAQEAESALLRAHAELASIRQAAAVEKEEASRKTSALAEYALRQEEERAAAEERTRLAERQAESLASVRESESAAALQTLEELEEKKAANDQLEAAMRQLALALDQAEDRAAQAKARAADQEHARRLAEETAKDAMAQRFAAECSLQETERRLRSLEQQVAELTAAKAAACQGHEDDDDDDGFCMIDSVSSASELE